VDLMESGCASDSLIDSQGTLDMSMLETMVSRYMSEAMVADSPYAKTREAFGNDNETSEQLFHDGYLTTPAENLSEKMEFMSMLYNNVQSSPQEEMEAVAAFRKTQDGRKIRDDTSSQSSFQVLPTGIRQKIQGLAKKTLSPSYEDDETAKSDSQIEDEYLSIEDSSAMASTSRSSAEFSPEKVRNFNSKVMQRSAFVGGAGEVIDTDAASDVSGAGANPNDLSHILLTPTILTKRHHQAIRAVESRNWEQVAYLLSANPWLSEMIDARTNQFLLHKLALFGTDEHGYDEHYGEVSLVRPAAPQQLNTDLVRMFPASVHKFDHDGNLPLHMASVSANLPVIKLLGERFPGGASVRNEDGMLVSTSVAVRFKPCHATSDHSRVCSDEAVAPCYNGSRISVF
jgi:hypothetical protein